MQTKNRIIIDFEIMAGKPTIKGTRITVELILRLLAQGQEIDQILKDYPHLKHQDIYAVLEYARDVIQDEKFLPIKNRMEYA